MAIDTNLGAALGSLLGRRRRGMPPGADTGSLEGIGGMPTRAGAGVPLGAGGVATVNPAMTRPGGTRMPTPAPPSATTPFPATPVTSDIDRHRRETQSQSAAIRSWNEYRRAERRAGRADPGQYAGGTPPTGG